MFCLKKKKKTVIHKQLNVGIKNIKIPKPFRHKIQKLKKKK